MLRADAATALNEATMRSIGNRSTVRGQSALVVLQVTLAVTLLVVATLVVRSLQAVNQVDVGYQMSGLLSTQIEIPTWKVSDDGEAFRLRQELLRKAAGLTGAAGATTASELPALQTLRMVTFSKGPQAQDDSARPSAGLTVASPDYFAVMGIPILRGRAFTGEDEASPAPVVVVSRTTAQRYWGEESHALGALITLEPSSADSQATATIVGIASDVANAGFELATRPHIYMLDAHRPTRSFYLIVRARSPETLAEELRAAVRRVDPDLPTLPASYR